MLWRNVQSFFFYIKKHSSSVWNDDVGCSLFFGVAILNDLYYVICNAYLWDYNIHRILVFIPVVLFILKKCNH